MQIGMDSYKNRVYSISMASVMGVAAMFGSDGCERRESPRSEAPIVKGEDPAFDKAAAAHNDRYGRIACRDISVKRDGNTLAIDITLDPSDVRGAWLSYEIQSSAPKVEGVAQGSPVGEDAAIALDGVGRAARLFVTVKIPQGQTTYSAVCDTVGIPR